MNVKSVLVLTLVVSLLTACGGSGDSAPVALPISTLGKAQLSAPLVGANVEAQDRLGRRLSGAEFPTDAGGTFTLPLAMAKGGRIRVVVTGGTHEGMPFDGKLLLDIDDFNPDAHLLYLNAATTLIGRYLDAHPEASVADASTRVKSFLQIPATSDAGADVDNPLQNYFRHEMLLSEARAGGSDFDAYLASLIKEMDRGVASHTFSRRPQLEGGVTDVVGRLIGTLGKEIAGESFAFVFDAITTALGIDGTAEILKELHEIQHKLDELTALSTKILSEIKYLQLEVLTASIQQDIDQIQQQYQNLKILGETKRPLCRLQGELVDLQVAPRIPVCNTDQAARLLQLRSDVEFAIKKILGEKGTSSIEDKLFNINAVLMPGVSGPGLLGHASEFLKTTRMFDPPVTDPRLDTLREYYRTVQAMGLHLMIEAYFGQLATSIAKDRANIALSSFNNNSKIQIDRVEELRQKNNDAMQDLRSKLYWLRAPISNIQRSSDISYPGHFNTFHQVEDICKEFARQKYAGFSGWRLPTDPEFHALVNGSPNSSGNADGGTGIFEWLIRQGFERAPDDATKNQRGVLPNVQTAYYSGTRAGAESYEALYDYGVDWAREFWFALSGGANHPKAPGAWCVTSGEPFE